MITISLYLFMRLLRHHPAWKTAWPYLLLLGLGYLLFFYRLGSYPLFDVDEPRYAEAAREMLENGNWITPYFNYELRFDKPIFHYWLIALAYKTFGISEFSARLWSAINALLSVLAVFWVGNRLISQRFGLMAALILATSLEFLGLSRMSITDMTLSTYMTLTTLSLLMVVRQSPKWWLAAGIFAALATLTKGPVGIVLPGGVVLIYCLFTRQLVQTFLNKWFGLALGIWFVISFPWYWLAYQANGQQFIDALFLHNVTRFQDTVSGHLQPWWFFFAVLAAGFIPWTGYLLTLWPQRSFWFGSDDVESHPLKPIVWFSLVWVVLIFAFFTAAGTKLMTYILPLFPGIALAMAAIWECALESTLTHKNQPALGWMKIVAWGMVAIAACFTALFTINMAAFMPREAAEIAGSPMNLVAGLVLTFGLLASAYLLTLRQVFPALLGNVLTITLVGLIALHGIVPKVNAVAQSGLLTFLKQIQVETQYWPKRHTEKGLPIIAYEVTRPSLTFYAKQKIDRVAFDDYDQFLSLVQTRPAVFVITKERFMDGFETNSRQAGLTFKLLNQQNRYALYKLEQTKLEHPKAHQPVKKPQA